MSDTHRRKKFQNIILIMVFLAYLIFNGILLFRHELWRDEANVWLMAKELSPLQLLAEIKYQGHPCLWYFLIMPFAKLGLPFQTIGFVSYLIMAAAAGLFLWRAPFFKPIKAIVLFSPAFTYYYSVIARNYCLIALILIILAVFYPKRNEKCVLYGLLLGLLVQSDVIALMTAGMISCMWLFENVWQCYRKKSMQPFWNILKGIWMPLFSLFFLIAQFYYISDSPVFQINSAGKLELLKEIRNYSYWILERLSGRSQNFCFLFFVLYLGLMLIASFQLKNIWAMVVMVSAYLFHAAFSVVVYQLHIWHFLSLCFVLIWAMWILYYQKEEKQTESWVTKAALGGLQILLLVLSACMFMQWDSEEEASSLNNALHGLYSDGVNTAEFIKENLSPDELIISVNIPWASTVLAYLPEYEFYFAGNGQRESYADWSEEQSGEISFEELQVWVETNFSDKKEFFLLDSGGSCLTNTEPLAECEILYQTQESTARGEEYTIYRIVP